MGLLDKLKKPTPAPAAQAAAPAATQATTAPTEEKRTFAEGLVSTKDIIAPSAIEVDFDHIRIDNRYHRTMFVAGYPRFVGINWLSPLINFDASLNISMYVYPTDGKEILDDLRRKIAEMEAEISTDIQRGKIVNPATQAKLEDALTLQQDLVKGVERFFQFGLYVTASADTKEDLHRISKNLESALGALMIITKKSTLQMEEGFLTTLPACSDKLKITRNMDTTSLATTFPFVSSDLSDDKGIMYGLNEHNGSLVIFDRFSMPNYNSVVFATAGAGKSYLIKLEAIRSLMLGTDIIVIDPENEYKSLCEAVGGQYIAFGYGEDSKINPFDLTLVEEEGENALNTKMLALHKLFHTMIGDMDPMEESILDRAIMDAYKQKGISPDPETQDKEPPLIEDLYKSLIGMEDQKAQMLAARFEKFIKGSFAGIFNQKTTVNLKNNFVVFGIRNLEEVLRPIAMHIVLDYIWTVVKKELRRRIMVVDEAWYMMQYPDSASFLRGIVKRGRKYYLGVTTITQDVDDFLETPYGKEIVTNSSIQILLKQHSAAIDKVGEVFYLSEGEKTLLLSADKGEGIFFAGQNHVAIRVIASEDEHRLITSNPEEVMRMKAEAAAKQKQQSLASEINKPVNLGGWKPQPAENEGLVSPMVKQAEAETEEEESKILTKENPVVTDSGEVLMKSVAPQPVPTTTVTTDPISQTAPAEAEIKTEVKNSEPVIQPEALSMKQVSEVVEESVKKEETTEATVPATNDRVRWQAEVIENKAREEKINGGVNPVNQQTDTGNQDQKTNDDGVENVLQRRIQEMEQMEKEELEEHDQKMKQEAEAKAKEEEEKKKAMGSWGGLPKYQDLFKAYSGNNGGGQKLPPLPPLPPLPKFETPVPQPPQLQKKPQPFLGEKPKTTDPIPAPPPAIMKVETMGTNNQPVTPPVKPTPAPAAASVPTEGNATSNSNGNITAANPAKPTETNKDETPKKPQTYDDLFGNGIV